jgi:glycosyltransferase involved in cell wall biosynthesis
MRPRISIVYVTHRADPRFAWFADSLAAQLDGTQPEVIVVDGYCDEARAAAIEATVAGRFAVRVVPPKPTVWNGAHQRTAVEYHACSNARNTGLVHARAPYVVFTDDCALLGPHWWARVREGARHAYVVGGAYEKRSDLAVEAGRLVDAGKRLGRDARWEQGDDDHVVPIGGGQLYGCTIGAPRELLLDVNGFDEICDSIGGEDCQFGLRLEFAGAPIFYDRRLLTIESDALHHTGTPLRRIDPELDRAAYDAHLQRFGLSERVVDGKLDASHLTLDLTLGLRSPGSLGNHFELAALRPETLGATAANLPDRYWVDGRLLTDL